MSTVVDSTPFLVAKSDGVRVGRETPSADDSVARAFELGTATEIRAWADTAELLGGVLPDRVANPLIVDDWRAVTKRAIDGGVALLFSAPPGVDAEYAGILDALMASKKSPVFVIDAPTSLAKALGDHAPTAQLWHVKGLAHRTMISSFAPPVDRRVVVDRANATTIEKRKTFERMLKADGEMPEQRYVLGIVLEPETVDSQGDIYSADEIERACHLWMENYQNTGHMHRILVNDGVHPVECYCAPVDFEINGQSVKQGTWLLGVHIVSDAIWQQVKSGDLTGFSIGGYAQRVPAQAPVPEQ